MSIEIFVMSERRLGSIAEWQKAIEREGFECDHSDPADLLDDDDLADIDFHRPWSQTLAFRFGRDFLALWGAFAAATAYARATGGVVFDGEAGEVLTPDKAAEIARDVELELGKT
jgi:hypothetical protein